MYYFTQVYYKYYTYVCIKMCFNVVSIFQVKCSYL